MRSLFNQRDTVTPKSVVFWHILGFLGHFPENNRIERRTSGSPLTVYKIVYKSEKSVYFIVRRLFNVQYVQINIHFFLYIYKIIWCRTAFFCIYTENIVYLNYLQNIGIAKKCICDCK